MRVLGIVAEYNPFHNGHRYHIQASREALGADYVVCAMSGAFVQRGEPAILDKWRRARAALDAGADIVLELPAAFALSCAEQFAAGAVRLFGSLNAVDFLSFGSETPLERLSELADFYLEESDPFKAALLASLDEGLSYPAARERATRLCLPDMPRDAILSPNSMLGIEYIKSIRRYAPQIRPYCVARIGDYHAPGLTGALSSASAIRARIAPALDPAVAQALTEVSFAELVAAIQAGQSPPDGQRLLSIVLALVRRADSAALARLPDIAEGLENRIARQSPTVESMDALIDSLLSKRYTAPRIRRALMHLLIGLERDAYMRMTESGPLYARPLGMKRDAAPLMRRIRERAAVPVVTQPARYKKEGGALWEMLSVDIRAQDICALLSPRARARRDSLDYTTPLVVL